ncbi:hypothetical protein D3C78_1362730 [compost metagenome]
MNRDDPGTGESLGPLGGQDPGSHVEGCLAHPIAVTASGLPMSLTQAARQIRERAEPQPALGGHEPAQAGTQGQVGPGIGLQAFPKPLGTHLLHSPLRHVAEIVQQTYGVDHHSRQGGGVIEGE